MSTAAQTLLEEFKSLPTPEQREVSWQIQRWLDTNETAPADTTPVRALTGTPAASDMSDAPTVGHTEALAALARLSGSSKGKGLLALLLADRAKERARG
ncbi:MAG: hypothetical protein RLZZ15_3850 [Verrucomicrobiota bacterium]|jgi:hypothetical protein